ncbi:MAG: cytochrome C oxidase subunit IV family protein [Candidatus Coatesbacteria bacterium]
MRPEGPSSRALALVWATLVALTGVTIAVSRLRIPGWSVPVALGVAAAKSSLVLAVFMRLRDEDRAFKVMLGVAVFTMAVILGLTFTDVAFR